MKFQSIKLLSFVSREYQIANIEKIVKYSESLLKPTYVSLDNYIGGNSAEYLEKNKKNYIALFWNPHALKISNFIINIKQLSKIINDGNSFFYLDDDSGYHVTLVLILSLIFNVKIIFYQHGYPWEPNKEFNWSTGWTKLPKRKIIIKNLKIILLFIFFSIFFKKFNFLKNLKFIVLNLRRKLVFVIAKVIFVYHNFFDHSNFLQINSKIKFCGSINYSNLRSAPSTDNSKPLRIVYFTSGALRSNSHSAISKQIKSIENYINLYKDTILVIKLKPGEKISKTLNLGSKHSIQSTPLKNLQDYNNLYVLPIDSNSCLECIQKGFKFITYNIFEKNSLVERIVKEYFFILNRNSDPNYEIDLLLRKYNLKIKTNIPKNICNMILNEFKFHQ